MYVFVVAMVVGFGRVDVCIGGGGGGDWEGGGGRP